MLEILDIALRRIDLRTRLPFRYGIAEMTALPHVFLTLRASFGQGEVSGIAADHLPPRWFTKNPGQSVQDEVTAMLGAIRHAASNAIGAKAESPFAWWRQAYDQQMAWAASRGIAPLLAHFGLSLVERALIHASTQAAAQPFHTRLLAGGLGFEPSEVHPELAGFAWRAAFPSKALPEITLRHTLGLSDPIETADINPGERLQDGLPQSLAESIKAYGLTHFKIKLSGDIDQDERRLTAALDCLQRNCGRDFAFSLDGNECYESMEAFGDAWARLSRAQAIAACRKRLLFIEQPVHRSKALQAASGAVDDHSLGDPVIIDESDAAIGSLPQALALGYSGTSHKNCKGVFKGLANKCLLAFKQATAAPSETYFQTGEDLSNIGPVALLQDLTVMASLSIQSVERNGHHYFKGLSAFPPEVNEAMAKAHPDLYTSTPQGYAAVRIREGKLDTRSLLASNFGPATNLPMDFADTIPINS